MKVFIAVTHLLGTGHLSRALTLGRRMAQDGHAVRLMSGGRLAPNLAVGDVELVQLPSVASDGTNFSRLLDGKGAEVTSDYMSTRQAEAIAALREFAPDVVITELFPFGRRNLTAEFLALLSAAHDLRPRPVIAASIRDILAPPSKPARAERTEEQVAEFYDTVLVHSDPALTPLAASWPVSARLEATLHYTGYVAGPPAQPTSEGVGEVLVSAGGGGVGQGMFECAIQAAAQSDAHWRLLVGGTDAQRRIDALKTLAQSNNITIEGLRPDFRQMLCRAGASVSMVGYNTAMDLLQAGVPSVLIPFDDGGEVEQSLRAASLVGMASVEVIRTDDLSPWTMAKAVHTVMAAGPRAVGNVRFDGADDTLHHLLTLAEARG